MAVYSTTFLNNGGHDGISKDRDSNVEFQVVNVLDGKPQPENTTNPEHLFAAALASCYGGAFLYHMAEAGKFSEVTTEVTLSLVEDETGNNHIQAVIHVDAPDLSEQDKKKFMELADQTSPYSRIFRGEAELKLK